MACFVRLDPSEAFLIKHFYGRAAQGDGAPRRFVQFGLRDAQVARFAEMGLKTGLAEAYPPLSMFAMLTVYYFQIQ